MSTPLPSKIHPVLPVLRWPGGKRGLVKNYSHLLLPRTQFKRFHDLTCGGGAVPFTHGYEVEKLFLNDALPEVHGLYSAIKDDVEALIDQASFLAGKIKIALRQSGNDAAREVFVDARMRLSDWRLGQSSATTTEAAAWMLVLNRTTVNGLHRISKKGRCNMPFRRDLLNKSAIDLVRADQLRDLGKLLTRTDATLTCGDFSEREDAIEEGDYVFVDPPYDPSPKRSLEGKSAQSFTAYTAAGFGEADHLRLDSLLDRIHEKGAHFTLTARSTPDTRARYAKWTVTSVQMRHNISPKNKGREDVAELVVSNFS